MKLVVLALDIQRTAFAILLAAAGMTAAGAALDPPGRLTGGIRAYVVGAKETVRLIGSRAGIDPRTIAHDNQIAANTSIRVGTELRLDDRHITPPQLRDRSIIVNVPQRMLFYADDTSLLVFPVAVGAAGWRTPLRAFAIREKEKNPTWDVPASIASEAREKGKSLPARVPPGPMNPLGRHYLALTIGSIGIHGTNAPGSVYQATTHGCIRVHPDDMQVLFDRVGVGTTGDFVYEPVLLTIEGTDVFLEVHPDIYRRQRPAGVVARELADRMRLTDLIDWTQADLVVAEHHGIARCVTRQH